MAERIRDARHERRLGADDDEVGVQEAREPEQPVAVIRRDRMTRGERRDPGTSRRRVELVERRRRRELPRQRVLPTARADEEDAHRRESTSPSGGLAGEHRVA